MLVVARPGVGRVGVDQRADFIQQRGVGAFARIDVVQVAWDQHRTDRIDVGLAGHDLRPRAQRVQVGGKPAGCGAAIGIGGQNHAVVAGELDRALHRHAPRNARACQVRRQFDIQDMHREWKGGCGRTHQRPRRIGAVIEAQHHAIEAREELRRQCPEAGHDLRGLVTDRYRYVRRTGQGRFPIQDQSCGSTPALRA